MVAFSVREHLLDHHEDFMLATLGVIIVLLIWAFFAKSFPKTGRPFFILLFVGLLGIMTVGADYGARMVYDYNAGGNVCLQPIDFTRWKRLRITNFNYRTGPCHCFQQDFSHHLDPSLTVILKERSH